jgi:hypothetical protein|tara:strand:- start:315 stop:788 length:474 start_codon:yes stop_codon:yes gene_type:complete
VIKIIKEFILKMIKEECNKEKAGLLIIRDTFTENSVIGKLYCNGEFISHTLELPWNNNKKRVSCIPKGDYKCRVRLARESGSRDYVHLLVENVDNRSHILFHRGNVPSDSKGCILTGTHRAEEPDKILDSKIAHTYLMKYILGKNLSLNINLIIKNR